MGYSGFITSAGLRADQRFDELRRIASSIVLAIKPFLILGLLLLIIIAIPAGNLIAQDYDRLLPESWGQTAADRGPGDLIAGLKMLEYFLKQDPLEKMANPQFLNEGQIRKRVDECRLIEEKLRSQAGTETLLAAGASLPKEDAQGLMPLIRQKNEILLLATHFSLFAQKQPGERIYNLSQKIILQLPLRVESEDRSYILEKAERIYDRIGQKWQSLGLDIPRGFIYVKVFSSLQDMREEFFLDESAHGVTIACRFVAVPWDQGRIEFKNTLTHEFVHVFTDALLGYGRLAGFPLWMEEGLATYLSRDPGTHLVSCKTFLDEEGNRIKQTTYATTSEDYMKWKSYFEYILSRYGQGKLGEFVRSSLRTASVPTALNAVLGLPAETAFQKQADEWLQKRAKLKFFLILFIILGGFAALFFFMRSPVKGLVAGLILFLPAVGMSFTQYFRLTTIYPWLTAGGGGVFFGTLLLLTLIGKRKEDGAEETYAAESDEPRSPGRSVPVSGEEAYYLQEIRRNPKNADAHDCLGTIWNNLGRVEEAECEYREAILLDPSRPDYHADLAGCLLEQRRVEEARHEAKLALEMGLREKHWVFEALGIKRDS